MNEDRTREQRTPAGTEPGWMPPGVTGESTSSPSPAAPTKAECSEALLRVFEFLDGELGPDDCAKIQAHLDECAPCLQEYDLDTTLKAIVKRSCGSEQAPDVLRSTIMSRISLTVVELEQGR
ncbi:mycothiol system anti-sigma-R factor [Terracoccus luteus]|uniref:Mycothiol system anti-sigma-R factor n=2 Tax=Terracoccus luteus TaxID=53356 RepID=A0A839PRW1_9MICO|nr:mycothiol system anti-sigma-R factor [Terracoccus luteus]MBB2985809.1 mycothiol system anti-sigma-R factor [Terracoccus luteus]MCP2171461.1 mycothiol system anti-sigma-R factor [Terracoccus luteus]